MNSTGKRGYRHVYALDDWLDVERETLSQIPPTTQTHDVCARLGALRQIDGWADRDRAGQLGG
jgi:hypothetical protein